MNFESSATSDLSLIQLIFHSKVPMIIMLSREDRENCILPGISCVMMKETDDDGPAQSCSILPPSFFTLHLLYSRDTKGNQTRTTILSRESRSERDFREFLLLWSDSSSFLQQEIKMHSVLSLLLNVSFTSKHLFVSLYSFLPLSFSPQLQCSLLVSPQLFNL